MLKVRDAVLVFAAALLLGLATISQAQAPKPAAKPAAVKPGHAKAVFAGGCFWCMEPPYDKLDGVVSTTSGYIGGQKKNPTYEEVSSGRTGHTEAVEVVYDPQKVSYQKLLDVFWRNIDPTVKTSSSATSARNTAAASSTITMTRGGSPTRPKRRSRNRSRSRARS